MGNDVWTLKCRYCNNDFNVSLSVGENVLNWISTMPCPYCQGKPRSALETPVSDRLNWHSVIDYRVAKNATGRL
jgi:hypothetical protein